jgi:hypothetical protein
MTLKVELGFTGAGSNPPFFTLDDATKGVLDSPTYVLGGGEGLVNVSEYVRDVSITRGKSRELDRYEAGQASVQFNNSTRAFDPTYVAGPFYGQIVPKRRLRISMDNIVQFDGLVDDWNLDFDAGGFSVASCNAFDGFSAIANQELAAFSPSQEVTGTRLNGVLDNIGWPADKRDINAGYSELAAEVVEDGTNALDYMQLIAVSEPGDVFLNKNGYIAFRDRLTTPTSESVVLSDLGDGIGYQGVRVVYGSELLYNFITATNAAGEYSTSDALSIALYGQRDLTQETLLANEADLIQLANYLLIKYSEPELRFESVVVDLRTVTAEQREDLLQLELADAVRVKLTPNNTPPTIEQFGKVVSLNYSFTPDVQTVEIGLASAAASFFVLDDAEFGRLDFNILAW